MFYVIGVMVVLCFCDVKRLFFRGFRGNFNFFDKIYKFTKKRIFMSAFTPFIALAVLIVTILGLIKPSLVPLLSLKNSLKNRGYVLLGGFLTILALMVYSASTTPKPKEQLKPRDSKPIASKPVTFTAEEQIELEKAKAAMKRQAEEEENKKAYDIARRDLFKEYIIKERKVLDAYWHSENQLWLTMRNNGRDRSGFADYVCTKSKTWGKDEKLMFKNDFMINVYDADKLLYKGDYVKIGEFFCKGKR